MAFVAEVRSLFPRQPVPWGPPRSTALDVMSTATLNYGILRRPHGGCGVAWGRCRAPLPHARAGGTVAKTISSVPPSSLAEQARRAPVRRYNICLRVIRE